MKKVFVTALLVALTGFVATAVNAQQKTVKACQEEWRANKAANQAAGKTEKAYVAECRAASAKEEPAKKPEKTKPAEAKPAKPAEAVPAKPAESTPAKPAEQPKATATERKAAAAVAGANQFTTEAQAKARCPSDTVVWVNFNSKIYHFAGHKDYGNTKRGAYACEKDTAAMGARAAKDEKHP